MIIKSENIDWEYILKIDSFEKKRNNSFQEAQLKLFF